MKILFVTRDRFPPFRPAAAAIFQVELVARGHSIDWVLQAANPQPSSVVRFGNGTAYVGAFGGGKSIARRLLARCQDLVNYFRVFGLIKKNHYDIVQAKDHYVPALITLIACKWYRVPFCYWLAYPHAEGSIYKAREGITRFRWYYLARGYLWKALLYRVLLPYAEHVFVQSEQMKRDLMLEGVPEEKMTPVPGSVDLATIPYDQASPPDVAVAEMGNDAIVYLGTLTRVRRLDFLLRAFAMMADKHPGAILFLLGKGDEPEDEVHLQVEAKKLGIQERVRFTGFLPMTLAWEYIRHAAACVSPYYPTMVLNSTSPTKLVEYMAMAKPTVGNDHPEQKLVLEGSRAGICVPYDVRAFADAMSQLLTDKQEANAMGLRGRKYVEQFRTNSYMANVVEEQYARLVGGAPGSTSGVEDPFEKDR